MVSKIADLWELQGAELALEHLVHSVGLWIESMNHYEITHVLSLLTFDHFVSVRLFFNLFRVSA